MFLHFLHSHFHSHNRPQAIDVSLEHPVAVAIATEPIASALDAEAKYQQALVGAEEGLLSGGEAKIDIPADGVGVSSKITTAEDLILEVAEDTLFSGAAANSLATSSPEVLESVVGRCTESKQEATVAKAGEAHPAVSVDSTLVTGKGLTPRSADEPTTTAASALVAVKGAIGAKSTKYTPVTFAAEDKTDSDGPVTETVNAAAEINIEDIGTPPNKLSLEYKEDAPAVVATEVLSSPVKEDTVPVGNAFIENAAFSPPGRLENTPSTAAVEKPSSVVEAKEALMTTGASTSPDKEVLVGAAQEKLSVAPKQPTVTSVDPGNMAGSKLDQPVTPIIAAAKEVVVGMVKTVTKKFFPEAVDDTPVVVNIAGDADVKQAAPVADAEEGLKVATTPLAPVTNVDKGKKAIKGLLPSSAAAGMPVWSEEKATAVTGEGTESKSGELEDAFVKVNIICGSDT